MSPNASRPYRLLVLSIAALIKDDAYLSMTEKEFVGAVVKESGGGVSPAVVSQEYHRLMAEAGASSSPAYSSYLNPT